MEEIFVRFSSAWLLWIFLSANQFWTLSGNLVFRWAVLWLQKLVTQTNLSLFFCSKKKIELELFYSILLNILLRYFLVNLNCDLMVASLKILAFSLNELKYWYCHEWSFIYVFRIDWMDHSYCGFINIHWKPIFVDFVVKLHQEIKSWLKCNFYQHFVLQCNRIICHKFMYPWNCNIHWIHQNRYPRILMKPQQSFKFFIAELQISS